MSYSNLRARLGAGTNNLAESGHYPLVRYSNDYMLLLSLYRSSWITRKVIDVLAEDMLKNMPRIQSTVAPDDLSKFDRVLRKTATQAKLLEALKWGRLFGGAVAVMVIDGVQDLKEPLDIDEVLPGKYRGLIVLDRWSGVYPDGELISDINNPAEFGLPKYYRCDLGSEGRSVTIHHSRLLRFVGRDLPNWEKQVQLYWGMSEVELIFDELKKFDYVNWNTVSLVSRAQILAMNDDQLSQGLSGLGMSQAMLENYVARLQAISDSISNQGLLALGKDAKLQTNSYSFGGLADVINLFLLNLAGACEIPVVKLVGRTISGLAQSNEGDLQLYDETVDQKRNRELLPQIEKLYRVIAASTWGEVPEDMDYEFPPIRSLNDKERAELAKSGGEIILGAFEKGVTGRKTTLKELRQLSEVTGFFSNITDEMIDEADDEVMPADMPGSGGIPPEALGEVSGAPAAKDSALGEAEVLSSAAA